MSQFYHVTPQRAMGVNKALTGHFTSPNDLNLILVKNSCLEVFDVTPEGLKQLRDVPVNAKILAATLFRRNDQKQDSLFLLDRCGQVAIIECQRANESIEFTTVASGSVLDSSARIIDQGFDALVDPKSKFIVIKLYHGLLKILPLCSLSDRGSSVDAFEPKVKVHSVRIEESNIVDMIFLHGYNSPTLAIIYEDEVVLLMKTYEIFGRVPALRPIPFSVDSIEPNSKLLIPVPTPHGGVIIVGDNIICYHTRDGPHISQYIPQSKASQVVCYAQVDAKRYLLGDMAGRLYMVHLLPDENALATAAASSSRDTSQATSRIGSIRIELLGETVVPESIVYLDNGVVFIGSFLGDSQLVRLNPELDPECNGYLTILEQFTNIGPIVDMVLLESKGQNQLITCTGGYKEGSLRVVRNGVGIQEHASVDQEQIKCVWCFPFESSGFDDSLVVSMVGQTQLLRLVEDDITALELEGFKVDEQTLYCNVLSIDNGSLSGSGDTAPSLPPSNLLLQATNSGLRLVGIQGLTGRGCLSTWRSPSGKSVSCMSSHGSLVLVASGSDLYALRITGTPEAPQFTQLSHTVLPHEAACIDMSPFDKATAAVAPAHSFQSPRSRALAKSLLSTTAKTLPSNQSLAEPEIVAVGLWLGHGIVLLKLPSLELLYNEPLPETTASLGTALLPRSILIAQLEEVAFLFAAMGDGSMYYYTIDCTTDNVCLKDAKRVNAGTGPSMHLNLWRSHNKANVFVCSNHPCIVYSNNNKLVFANVNLKEIIWMSTLNGSYYSDCICMVTPAGLVLGSVDNLQKLHVRAVPLGESPRRLAIQPETGSLAVITHRQEVFVEGGGGFRPVCPSVSITTKVPKSVSVVPKTVPPPTAVSKFPDVEVSSLLLYSLSNMELQFVHTFHYGQTMVEIAMSIAAVHIGGGDETSSSSIAGGVGGVVYAVGTALFVKGEAEPRRGRIHIFRWDHENARLETLVVHDVNGCVYCLVDFNGRLLAGVRSSVRLFDIYPDNLRLVCSYNENILVLYLRSKGDFVLIGDLMRSISLLLYKPNMNAFEVVGRHHFPRFTTGTAILDDEYFMAAESNGNIYVVGRDSQQNTKEPYVPAFSVTLPGRTAAQLKLKSSDEATASSGNSSGSIVHQPASSSGPSEMRSLVDCAFLYVGESINTFVKGNLILQNSEERWSAVGDCQVLYGTAQGCIGLVIQLSPILFAFLKEVQERISQIIMPVGSFNHESWRAYKDDAQKVRVSRNFIDGELVETFIDLSAEEKACVCDGLRMPVSMEDFGVAGFASFKEPMATRICTVEDLTKVIEEMASRH